VENDRYEENDEHGREIASFTMTTTMTVNEWSFAFLGKKKGVSFEG